MLVIMNVSMKKNHKIFASLGTTEVEGNILT